MTGRIQIEPTLVLQPSRSFRQGSDTILSSLNQQIWWECGVGQEGPSWEQGVQF
jgi:hypothetical protein